jgi:hypothetical protein
LPAQASDAGHPFPVMDSSKLLLGVTTPADVETWLGPPYRHLQRQATEGGSARGRTDFDSAPVAGLYEFNDYFYADESKPQVGGKPANKELSFYFFDGKLSGFFFVSNLPGVDTAFDTSVISQIHRGASTQADVQRLLGPPTGKSTYPGLLNPGDIQFCYWSQSADPASPDRLLEKRLLVLFDARGVVKDYRYKEWTPGHY